MLKKLCLIISLVCAVQPVGEWYSPNSLLGSACSLAHGAGQAISKGLSSASGYLLEKASDNKPAAACAVGALAASIAAAYWLRNKEHIVNSARNASDRSDAYHFTRDLNDRGYSRDELINLKRSLEGLDQQIASFQTDVGEKLDTHSDRLRRSERRFTKLKEVLQNKEVGFQGRIDELEKIVTRFERERDQLVSRYQQDLGISRSRGQKLIDEKEAMIFAINRFIEYLKNKEEDAQFGVEIVDSVQNLDDKREAIFAKMSRFGQAFPDSYRSGLIANQDKITRATNIRISPENVYEYLDLTSDFAGNLPFQVILQVIGRKVHSLEEGSLIDTEAANMLQRQLDWIFKNEEAKKNYDAFISGTLDRLIFEVPEEFERLSVELEVAIEDKNALAEAQELSSQYIYGDLNRKLIRFLQRDGGVNRIFSKASIYFPTLWQYGQAGNMVRSILRGALVTHSLLNEGNPLSGQIHSVLNFDEDKVATARDIMNYFFALAVNKKQWFEEGTFMVHHSGANNIFEFLKSAGSGRPSSHFKKLKLDQYGLDIPGMPEYKTHLLFAELAPNVLFVKPENYGLGFSGVVGHSWEFVIAQSRKLVPGADQAAGMRKERIPSGALSRYADLLESLSIDPDLQDIYLTEARDLGIQSIYTKLLVFEDDFKDVADLESIQNFKRNLEDEYDYLKRRFGQEVILGEQELNLFTPEFLQNLVDEFSDDLIVR
jgi:hypothetical protein